MFLVWYSGNGNRSISVIMIIYIKQTNFLPGNTRYVYSIIHSAIHYIRHQNSEMKLLEACLRSRKVRMSRQSGAKQAWEEDNIPL